MPDLPRYFIVGLRPVKAVAVPGGGMDVLAWDWTAKTFVREMSYLSRIFGSDPEVDVVSAEEFEAAVAELRAK